MKSGASGSRRAHHHVPITTLPPSLQLRRFGNCLSRSCRGFPFLCLSWNRWKSCWDHFGTCVENTLDWLIRTLGPFYVVLALGLIGSVVYLYFALLLPAAFESQPRWMAGLHVAGAMWLAFNILFNYFLCIYTDPGHPPPEPALMSFMETQRDKHHVSHPHPPSHPSIAQSQSLPPPFSRDGTRLPIDSSMEGPAQTSSRSTGTEENQGHVGLSMPRGGTPEDDGPLRSLVSAGGPGERRAGTGRMAMPVLIKGPQTESTATATLALPNVPLTFRWCKLCKRRKAPMTHHCYVCKRCVLKMDHHCPWMNNCVGFRNYRYFFCFVLNLWIGCVYAVQIAASLLFSKHKVDAGVIFTFVVALAVFVALSLLMSWHLYLASTAQTTIDFYDYRMKRRDAKRQGKTWRNEFDLGFKRNLVVALQLAPPLWGFGLLLPQVVHMQGDGMRFPTVSSKNPDSAQAVHSLLTEYLETNGSLDSQAVKLFERDLPV